MSVSILVSCMNELYEIEMRLSMINQPENLLGNGPSRHDDAEQTN